MEGMNCIWAPRWTKGRVTVQGKFEELRTVDLVEMWPQFVDELFDRVTTTVLAAGRYRVDEFLAGCGIVDVADGDDRTDDHGWHHRQLRKANLCKKLGEQRVQQCVVRFGQMDGGTAHQAAFQIRQGDRPLRRRALAGQ